MISKDFWFEIEVWDPQKRRYVRAWTGRSGSWAATMFNKPYYVEHRRRLVRHSVEVLGKAAGRRQLVLEF